MKPKAKGTVGFLLILLLIFPLHVYAGGKYSDVESQDQEDHYRAAAGRDQERLDIRFR